MAWYFLSLIPMHNPCSICSNHRTIILTMWFHNLFSTPTCFVVPTISSLSSQMQWKYWLWDENCLEYCWWFNKSFSLSDLLSDYHMISSSFWRESWIYWKYLIHQIHFYGYQNYILLSWLYSSTRGYQTKRVQTGCHW